MSLIETALVPADQHEGPTNTRLPFVLVLDISSSMTDVEADLNEVATVISLELAAVPRIAQAVELAIVTFSDNAFEHLPMGPPDLSQHVAPIRCGGSTNYTAAFELLDQLLAGEIGRFTAEGVKAHRPTVFFLTDGQPNTGGDWQQALAQLQARSYRPNLFAFGYGTTDPTVLQQVANVAGFQFGQGRPDRTTLIEFADKIVGTIIGSATTGELDPNLAIPKGATVLPPIQIDTVN